MPVAGFFCSSTWAYSLYVMASAASLLPDRESAQAQSEQLRQPLELLLAILADLARLGAGREPALAPWRARLESVARPDPRELQRLIFTAQRNLMRNPVAESMLREMALALRG